MKSRLFVLGLALAAFATPAFAQVPAKMPVPVEDDTNAPAEIRGNGPPPAQAAETPPAAGSPGSYALVAYNAGDYEKAFDAIKGIDPATQHENFIILESRILTELKRYDDGEKLLQQRINVIRAHTTPPDDLIIALGDLLLHKRSYDRAAWYYTTALKAKPTDPDLILRLVYARIGSGDLRAADQIASQLSPFDPKKPYDDHASYYFARAALAQATGKSEEADEDIQNARTNYGISVTNSYLKMYLHFFAPADKNAATNITPDRKT